MVLYILLNNKKMPFVGADQVPVVDDVMNAISRRYHGAKIPEPKYGSPALKKVVLKACEFKAENRYHSAKMMYKALEIAERGGNPDTESGVYSENRTSSGSRAMVKAEPVAEAEPVVEIEHTEEAVVTARVRQVPEA